ncbi:F-box/FBD/LRR-repeat protein At1g13570 [Linum grandiflorum]
MARSSVDRISSLPDGVRERILMSLPLRDAAKCSILSTKWRNLWTYLPTLAIDQSFGLPILERQLIRCNDYEEDVVERLITLDVCKVLMLHRGPLKEFSLPHAMLGDQVDEVLRFLPFKTIEKLTIGEGPYGSSYLKLSKTLFTSFSQLKTLNLSFCKLSFSAVSFEGFDRLTVLQLRNVKFSGSQPQLSFRCPLLTTLILERCYSGLSYPRIVVEEAPLLECLYLVGCFSYLLMNATSLLKTLTVHEIPIENSFHCDSVLLGEASGTVEALSIEIGNICEYVTSRERWVKLRQLRLVEVERRRLNTRSNLLAVVRMIMNSPNLQRLEIEMQHLSLDESDYEDYDEDDDDPDYEAVGITELRDVASEYEQLRLLKKVEVYEMRGTKNEMTLISWLLNSIPALDQMKIQISTALSKDKLLRVVIQLNKFEMASSKTQIIINSNHHLKG